MPSLFLILPQAHERLARPRRIPKQPENTALADPRDFPDVFLRGVAEVLDLRIRGLDGVSRRIQRNGFLKPSPDDGLAPPLEKARQISPVLDLGSVDLFRGRHRWNWRREFGRRVGYRSLSR